MTLLGKIKIVKDGEQAVLPITRAEAVYLNKETTVAQKLRELEELLTNGHTLSRVNDVTIGELIGEEILQSVDGVWVARHLGGNYFIDNEKWGIVSGVPTKPYVAADYNKALKNIEGINSALARAQSLGYKTVTLKKGEYSVCYPTSILIPDSTTLDLGNSKIKVMYDSENRSPYDTNATSYPIYKFAGVLFKLKGVYNAHITNGDIEGDVYDRAYTNNLETGMEQTYGIEITEGSSFCSVTKCKVHGFTGDNIGFVSGGLTRGIISEVGNTRGDLDKTTGAIVTPVDISTSTTMYSSSFTIDPIKYKTFSIGGQGFARNTNLNQKTFDVYYYDKNGIFLGYLPLQKIQSPITVARKAATFRLKFYKETDPTKNFQIFLNYGSDCHHNVIEYNEIYDGHRGGMALGGSYNLVQKNLFRDNGKFSSAWLDGVPTFSDTTRYAINQEDSFGEHTIIRNNVITGGWHGILIRTWGAIIEGNTFSYIDSSAIVLYTLDYVTIQNNYILSGSITSMGTNLGGKTIISNNKLVSVNIDASYDVLLTNNHIAGNVILKNGVVKNNQFESILGCEVDAKYVQNNNFKAKPLVAGTLVELVIRENGRIDFDFIWENNTFEGYNLLINQKTINMLHKNSKFTNCMLNNTLSSPISIDVKLLECELINTYLDMPTANAANRVRWVMEKSKSTIKSTSANTMFFNLTSNNTPEALNLKVKDCELITEKAIPALFPGRQYNNCCNIEMYNTKVKYTGTGVLPMITFTIVQTNSAFVSGNTFENIAPNFPIDTTKIFYFDPTTAGLAEPTNGYFQQGAKWEKGHRGAGDFEGWIAITGGFANNNPWAATTVYALNDIVNVGGKVYQVTTAGTSGNTAPTHTTGTPATGTVVFSYLAPKAVFKPYGSVQA